MPHPRPALADGSALADAALMARVACGDAQALDPLYRRHKGIVYRFALLWSGSSAIAADVTQDVFLHLLERAGDYDALRGAVSPWLLGIARNFVRRRTGLTRETALDTNDEALLAGARIQDAPPDAALALAQDLERLRRAIAALPPHYRDVLVLVELAERSYAETAAICGCELNTVRSRLSRARGLLAQWLTLDDETSAMSTAASA
ncbi:MAG TPA: RNA polymerase sigma factor [Casimicrobiaceae bacterium]|nr:RNA polymerase sigma factor [Casimicrobiaceae bacterium]